MQNRTQALAIAAFATLLILGSTAMTSTAEPAAQPAPPAGPDWKPLFNGKDLTGWYTFLHGPGAAKGPGKDSDPDHIIQIHDGMIHMYKDAPNATSQPVGYMCTTQEYGDCRIKLEFKWGTKRFGTRATRPRDAGLLYFAYGEDGWQGGTWPHSVECQIQEHDVGDTFAVGTIVSTTADPATTRPASPTSTAKIVPTFMELAAGGVPFTTIGTQNDRVIRSPELDSLTEWNTVEVILEGDSAVHIVNGKVNMRLTHITRGYPAEPKDRTPLTKGRILLQAEAAEVMYRNVMIQPLHTEKK